MLLQRNVSLHSAAPPRPMPAVQTRVAETELERLRVRKFFFDNYENKYPYKYMRADTYSLGSCLLCRAK